MEGRCIEHWTDPGRRAFPVSSKGMFSMKATKSSARGGLENVGSCQRQSSEQPWFRTSH